MTPEQITRAAILVEALSDISITRDWLKAPKKPGADLRLELAAVEVEDAGGTGHGVTFLPADFAGQILDLAEQLTRDELATLGVNMEGKKE